MEKDGALSTVLLPSETFVLNPLHRTVRARAEYDVCGVAYFHSIICSCVPCPGVAGGWTKL